MYRKMHGVFLKMQDTEQTIHEVAQEGVRAARCPIDHSAISEQKTTRSVELPGPAIAQDEQGVWHVRSFSTARAILRSPDTRQAGFNADIIGQVPGQINQPILYQEGKAPASAQADRAFLHTENSQRKLPPVDGEVER